MSILYSTVLITKALLGSHRKKGIQTKSLTVCFILLIISRTIGALENYVEQLQPYLLQLSNSVQEMQKKDTM